MKVIRLPKTMAEENTTIDMVRNQIVASGGGWFDWEKSIRVEHGLVLVSCSELPGVSPIHERVAAAGSYIVRNDQGGLNIAHSILGEL